MSLDRMWPLLELVGNPQHSLRVIHVAGTSGKTSTCYYINHCLVAAGNKCGLTVSPHVDSITERVQINGQPLSEELFCRYLSEFLQHISAASVQPSYFELLTVFELWVFVREQVDYAVIETGMGGLWDASNAVTSASKVCVITDIGYDHMHILGSTIQEIAAQKAGIIHTENAVLMHKQTDAVMKQITDRISTVLAQSVVCVDQIVGFDDLPLYQQRNWSLAGAVCDYVAKRDGFTLDTDFDPSLIVVPGRMDASVLENNTTLVMDGAHNRQKMTAFVESFQHQYPDKSAVVLLALKQGKDYKDVLQALLPIVSRLVVTTFSTSQDMPAVSQDPSTIAEYAQSLGIATTVQSDHTIAYKELLKTNDQLKIVTGSFYLLGQVRSAKK